MSSADVAAVDGGEPSIRELRRKLAAAIDGGRPVLPVGTRADDAALRAALRPDDPIERDTALIVATSGSTGPPKGVLLSARALTASATATHARLGGAGHWLLATPAHYIGGIQVLVRSLLAGTQPHVMELAAGFRPDGFAAAAATVLRQDGPRYTALVPTQLVRLLDAGGAAVEAARAFDAIVIGGAPMPPALRRRAADAGITAVAAYGMSETASGCVYDGIELDGVSVHIGADDRISVAGDVLANGYRLRPDLTAASFVDGWYVTNDVGRRSDDGRLEVLGRADDVINTGGVKIAAAAVEQALREHGGVADACVVGVPDRQWGQAVGAVVVPNPSERLDPAELTEHVRARAGAPAMPRRLLLSDQLPTTGPGKPDRATVAAWLESHPDTAL